MLFNFLSKRKTDQPSFDRGFSSFTNKLFIPKRNSLNITEETALTFSAVFACAKILSESIATLPWQVMREDGEFKYKAPEHPVNTLLKRRPNSEMEPMTFKTVVMLHLALWGVHYSEVEYNRAGIPIALWPLHPSKVAPCRDSGGKLFYKYTNDDGTTTELSSRQVFRVLGLTLDGVTPISVIGHAKRSIELGLFAEEYGSSFFANSAIPSGLIKAPSTAKMSPEAVKNMLQTWGRRNSGTNSRGIEYLDQGMEFEQIGIPPEDAQFLVTRKFQLTEIARWFRMPPHKLAELERAQHNNIESQNIEFVTDTLMPWVTRLEEAVNFQLLREPDHFSKMNMNAYLRGDAKSRAEFYKTMIDRGVYSIDDVLQKEDQNPLEGGIGQLRMVPLNMISVEQAARNGSTQQQQESRAMQNTETVQYIARWLADKQVRAVGNMVERGATADKFAAFFDRHAQHIKESLIPIYADSGLPSGNIDERISKFILSADITGKASASDIAEKLIDEVFNYV